MSNTTVLSDVDGTIVKGSLVLDHACFLHKQGIVNLGDLPSDWKRSKKNERRITALAEAYKDTIIGMSVRDLHVRDYLQQLMSDERNFYSTLARLITLQEHGAHVRLISGSPSFLINPFAKTFGFTGKGSDYKRDTHGRFTGEVVGLFGAAAKRKYIAGMKRTVTGDVMAFGDTMSDVPLFENAHYTVLVDPSKTTKASLNDINEIVLT